MSRLSIAARLTMLYAAAAVLVLGIIGIYFERAIDKHFDALDTADLRQAIGAIRSVFDSSGQLTAEQAGELERALQGRPGISLVVTDASGQERFRFTRDPRLREALAAAAAGATTREQTLVLFVPDRQMAVTAVAGDGVRIAAAKDAREHAHFTGALRTAFWSTLILGGVALGAIGAAIARWSLRPVHAIASRARSITANRLDLRIDVGATPVELRELARAFNEMLDRLATDFQRLTDFSADLAHELRSPLSNLVTQTQVVLNRTRSADEYRELLASNLEEFERMSRIIGDLLFLAKAEHGIPGLRQDPISLRPMVSRVWEYYGLLAEERGIQLNVRGEAEIRGDKGLMERLVANLISNAVRHANAHSAIDIDISADTDSGDAVLEVSNEGPVIPEAHLARLFDRFYRVDAARSGSIEHIGLGLAIARSIAELHHGRIVATSRDGRTTFTVHIPGAARSVHPSTTPGDNR